MLTAPPFAFTNLLNNEADFKTVFKKKIIPNHIISENSILRENVAKMEIKNFIFVFFFLLAFQSNPVFSSELKNDLQCFVAGECVDSIHIDGKVTDDEV